jgi:hypothetical protein
LILPRIDVDVRRTQMAHREVKSRAADDADAFSVAEFCRRHGISLQLFYKLKNQMPVTMRVGTRVLISKEAAAAWRRERETATAARNTA